jgi:hypothetical protein
MIFEPNKEKGTGELRKLRNKELHNLYYPLILMSEYEIGGHVARMGTDNYVQYFSRKTERKKLLNRCKRRGMGDFQLDLK